MSDSDAANRSSDPLTNLARLHTQVSSLRLSLSAALASHTPISSSDLHVISSHLVSAVHHTIHHASSLLSPHPTVEHNPPSDVVEIDADELLAEHHHFCEICGKGFKRSANLRMHMRAHGEKFKTLDSLSGAGVVSSAGAAPARFSCPFPGCNRNRRHDRFKALKSVICLKNHYRRSHCPKTFGCDVCGKKRFAVEADLRSHKKHCGEERKHVWRCSCGTRFSRKDKLFGHVGLFKGHFPAVEREDEEEGNGEPFDDLMDELDGVDERFLVDRPPDFLDF